jgi:HK97 gp10 family phage protein
MADAAVRGVGEMITRMQALDKKLRDQGLKKAVTEGGKPVVAATKATAPQRTGLLRQSIGEKVLKTKRGEDGYSALIGAKHLRITKKRKKAGFKISKRVRRAIKRTIYDGGANLDPARYLHLVELGHKAPRAKGLLKRLKRLVRRVGSTPGRHFMAAAVKTAEQQALDAIRQSLAEFIAANLK